MLKLVYMNEGENTGMPNTPDFSSPNASPDNTQPIQPATPPDSTASVAAAAASLPGEDPSQPAGIISSGDTTPASARPRFGFSRKFKPQSDVQPAKSAFKNAPDYFNQAVGDIVLADENAVAQKKKVKKIALIVVAALVVIGGGLAAFLLLNQANKPSANKVKTAFNRYANYVLYGEEKDSDIGEYSASTRYTIMDKYIDYDENYNKRFKELFDKFYEEFNAAAENGIYEKGGADGFKSAVYAVYDSFEMDKKYSFAQITDDFLSKGKDGTTDIIESKYESSRERTTYRYPDDWRALRMEYVKLLEIYSSNGCALFGSLEGNCAKKVNEGQEAAALLKSIENLGEEEAVSRIEIRDTMMSIIWSYKDKK